MSKRFEVTDMDAIFHSINNPLIINDLPSETEGEREIINNIILTTYDKMDVLSTCPSCVCGKLINGYNLGKTCEACNTVVIRPVEDSIDLRVWLRVPDDIKGFILPVVWIQLSRLLTPSGYNLMEWLTNSRSRLPAKLSPTTEKRINYLNSINWIRGLRYFQDNFDTFINLLPELKIPSAELYQEYLRSIRTLVFPKYLPMPTKALLVLEKTHVGNFADLSITTAIDAARTIVSISSETEKAKEHSVEYLESKTVSVIKNLSSYYNDTIKENFCPKKGWLRGQIFSSRSHFCMRLVITSITKPHHYEDLHIPWAQGLVLFSIHLVNKLLKRGYNLKDAHALVENSGNIYVPLLAILMQELIDEAPDRGVSVIMQRNQLGSLCW